MGVLPYMGPVFQISAKLAKSWKTGPIQGKTPISRTTYMIFLLKKHAGSLK